MFSDAAQFPTWGNIEIDDDDDVLWLVKKARTTSLTNQR